MPGDIMEMCVEESIGAWYNSLPGTAGIYRIINEARHGSTEEKRIEAVISLGESGDPRAVRTLIMSCTNENPDIRRHATEGLGKLRSSRAVCALAGRLEDREELPEVRLGAAAALASIRTNSSMESLRTRLSDPEETAQIRMFISGVL
jgi:HEAT repeat protein